MKKKTIGWLLFFFGIIVSIFGGVELTRFFSLQGLIVLIIGLIMLYFGYVFYYKNKEGKKK